MKSSIHITDAQKQQFQEDGYFILKSVIPTHFLQLLRGECQTFIDQANAEMDRQNTDVLGLNHRNKRYFVANCFQQQPKLREFLFGELMAEICSVQRSAIRHTFSGNSTSSKAPTAA